MDTVVFNDCFQRSLFFDYGWEPVTGQRLRDAWFGWPDVIHPGDKSSVFEQFITAHSRRATLDVFCRLAAGRKVRAVMQPVFLGETYIGHVGLVSDRAGAPSAEELIPYLQRRKLLPGIQQPGEFRNLLAGEDEEIDSQIVRERAQTVLWDIQPREQQPLKGPHLRNGHKLRNRKGHANGNGNGHANGNDHASGKGRSRSNGHSNGNGHHMHSSVPVLLISGAMVREVVRCPSVEFAQQYATEYNQREAMLPTGFIAVVHPAYLLTGEPSQS